MRDLHKVKLNMELMLLDINQLKMSKTKTHVQKQGSWIVFFILCIFPPFAFLYWLFKMRKTKTYSYEK